MGVRVLCGLLVAALLVGTTAEANARGRRGSGGRTTHYHYGIGAVGTPRSQPANPPAPAAQNQFPPCPPQAPAAPCIAWKLHPPRHCRWARR